MKEDKEIAEAMQPAEETKWLSNCRIDVGAALLVTPRFEASDRGIKGIVAAVKAIFVDPPFTDRIKEPINVGDEPRAMTACSLVALAAYFVRCAVERIVRVEAAPQARAGKSELPRTAWIIPGVLMRSSACLAVPLSCIAVCV